MDNPNNQVPTDIITDNPQATQSTELGAGSVDFQQALPSDSLNNQGLSLGLEESVSEQPGTIPTELVISNSQLPVFWLTAVGIIILVAVFLLYKLIKEASEEVDYENSTESVKESKPKKSAGAKKASSAVRKKSAPNQRRKNVSKKRKK